MKNYITPVAAGVVLAMASTTVQAKSTIGGVVFTNYYVNQQEDIGGVQGNDRTNSILDVANNSRFRIKWDNEDSVSMYIELALRDDEKDNIRHAYGKWDISETHQLLVGQTSTPFAPLNPNVAMVNNSGQAYGSVSPSRPSQIRYTYKFLNRQGAFAVALVDPNGGKDPVGAGQRETTIPRIDLGLAYKTFNWQIFPSAFFHDQSYTEGDDLTSYGYSLGAKTGAGAFTFAAEVGGGRNWGNTKMSISGSDAGNNAGAVYDAVGRRLEDTDNTGYWVDLGWRFHGTEIKGSAHFIYGALSSDADGYFDYESNMVGLSIPIDLPWIARGFRIRPEIFRFEDEDKLTGVDRTQTIYGVQLQYTF
ncbi:MAG: hypothetical protein ACI9FJ_000988 [Alteromonadaceae bacterium]|jgi:hypothetical protein